VGQILERVGRAIQREKSACKVKAVSLAKEKEKVALDSDMVQKPGEAKTGKNMYSFKASENAAIMKLRQRLACFRVSVHPYHRKSGVFHSPPLMTGIHRRHRIVSIRWLRT
jgi:hypothetical protein